MELVGGVCVINGPTPSSFGLQWHNSLLLFLMMVFCAFQPSGFLELPDTYNDIFVSKLFKRRKTLSMYKKKASFWVIGGISRPKTTIFLKQFSYIYIFFCKNLNLGLLAHCGGPSPQDCSKLVWLVHIFLFFSQNEIFITVGPCHWCIKSVYNWFAKAMRLYLKSYAFRFLFCQTHASFQRWWWDS